jgi:hypothetical protein
MLKSRLAPVPFDSYTLSVSTNYLFHDAAFKHGVSETDIRRAFARPLFDGLLEDYDDKFLLTGFDAHGIMVAESGLGGAHGYDDCRRLVRRIYYRQSPGYRTVAGGDYSCLGT